MQKRNIDAQVTFALCVLFLSVCAPAQGAPASGFSSKLHSHLLGKVQLFVTRDQAKIFVENTKTSYLGDSQGQVIVYSDVTKRRHDTTVRDFFPPGQKTQLMVSGLDLRRVPFDLKGKTSSLSGKLQTSSYPFSPVFLRKEVDEIKRTGIRRYRVQSGHYEVFEKMTVSKNVLAFLQAFFGLPQSPSGIPISLEFLDWKDVQRPWVTTRSNRIEPIDGKIFAAPKYARVATVHGVNADAEDDHSTGEYFESLSKFIHK